MEPQAIILKEPDKKVMIKISVQLQHISEIIISFHI